VRRGEEAVNGFFKSVGGFVGEEGVDLLEGGRQADEVEADAAEEGFAGGFGRGRDTLAFETREDESVDRGLRPVRVLNGGRFAARGRHKGPMLAPRGAFLDPAADEFG